MKNASFERWAADYVKSISWGGEAEGSRRKRQFDKVVADRADALRFLSEHGQELSLDTIVGDPPEVNLLTFAIRAEDEELGLALVRAGASTTRIFSEPSRADDGPMHVYCRPLTFARKKNLTALAEALATPEALAIEAEDERRRVARTPGPESRFANVWATATRWIFLPLAGTAGESGTTRGIPGITTCERTSSASEIRTMLRAALAGFSTTYADAAGIARMQKEQLHAVGVKKESALYGAVRLVSVALDDKKLVLTRWISQKASFMPTTDSLVVERSASDEVLVEALERLTAGSEK